ncbi:MAG: hypothetical protein CMI67_12550, partial [Pelagibaca sp.]|nr:hypothetical protein [Pelagibaca sp.]
GCPWDRAQTRLTLRPYLVEEIYELLEAVEHGDPAAQRAETGDALFLLLLMTRIAREGPPVIVVHPDRQQRGGRLEPGHRHEAALGRIEHAVAVAGLEDEGAFVDILAPDVEIEDREREAGAVLDHLVGEARGHTLAAWLSVEVACSHTDGADLRVLAQPAFGVVHGSP